MPSLKVENAWVEFPVSSQKFFSQQQAYTGGHIDSQRGVVVALQDINFELKEGDRLGLMGHNGAGKSTMLRMLAGAYVPTRGRVLSTGRISTLLNTTPGLQQDGTGRENILTCGLHLGIGYKQVMSKMDEIVEFAELGDYIDMPVRIYSSGMMTRLGFSIATSIEPEILLLDEGLATGDARFAQKAQQRMKALMECSAILVIASHSMGLLEELCTRCLLLDGGRIVQDGKPEALHQSYIESVIAGARYDDKASLHKAYGLATDMLKRDQDIPPELEELSLRYALGVKPDDVLMTRRFLKIFEIQGKTFTPDHEVALLLTILEQIAGNESERLRLKTIVTKHSDVLDEKLKSRAEALLHTEPN